MNLVICSFCKHYEGGHKGTCKAFPEGIPFEIFTGKVKHIFPVMGDHGVQFEAEDSEAERITGPIVEAARNRMRREGLLNVDEAG